MAHVLRPAVFLDRDGTLVRYVPYLATPEQVQLEVGAAEAIVSLRDAGYVCVVVTNQAAIAKGMLTESGLEEIHAEMLRQLAEAGASLDGIYHCPAASMVKDPTVVEFFDRKPGPGMLLRAARELRLDIGQSWMVGDNISDILAGHNAGCRGSIWVAERFADQLLPDGITCHRTPDIATAAKWILRSGG